MIYEGGPSHEEHLLQARFIYFLARWHRDEAQRNRLRNAAEDAKKGDKEKGGGAGGRAAVLIQPSTNAECRNETIDRVARYRSVRLALTDVCLRLPLLRVPSSVQQISVLPECICVQSGSLSEVLASFVFCFISALFCYDFVVFLFIFFWSCLCCCVIIPGTLVFHLLDTWTCGYCSGGGLPLSRSLWPQNQYLSRIRNQDGLWVCRWSWVERTIQCEDNNNNNKHNNVLLMLCRIGEMMGRDTKWTMFADYHDGMYKPCNEGNDVCWPFWWEGWTMIWSEGYLLTIMMGWIDYDTKWTIFADDHVMLDAPWSRLNNGCWLLRGAIVNRTYVIHKNLYMYPFLLFITTLGPTNYCPPY